MLQHMPVPLWGTVLQGLSTGDVCDDHASSMPAGHYLYLPMQLAMHAPAVSHAHVHMLQFSWRYFLCLCSVKAEACQKGAGGSNHPAQQDIAKHQHGCQMGVRSDGRVSAGYY